jgi:uncharacterized RDD family membrane protein YckC
MDYGIKLPKRREVMGDASLWKRGLAFFTDLVIIDFVIGTPLTGPLTALVPQGGDSFSNYDYFMSNPGISGKVFSIFMALGILAFIYFVLFEYMLQQTPGKMLSRLYVKPLDKKQKLTFFQCVLRNLFIIPVFPLFLLWIIDPIFLVVKKQRLSDIIANTTVTEVYVI